MAEGATDSPGLSSGFYASSLQLLVREFQHEARVHLLRGGGLCVLGLLLIVLAQVLPARTDKIQTALLTAAGVFLTSITTIPVNAIFVIRRKTAILEGYRTELSRTPPPREAVDAVKAYLGDQLKEAGK